jgi:hypothetical protein
LENYRNVVDFWLWRKVSATAPLEIVSRGLP